MYDFDWSSIRGALPFLAHGLYISLQITACAVSFGIICSRMTIPENASVRTGSSP